LLTFLPAPSRTGDDDGTVVCHWCPLEPDEKKHYEKLVREEKKKHKGDGTPISVNHIDIFQDLNFRRTFDRPQFSMNILFKLVPDASKCRVVDIYTRRQPIRDVEGNRLTGKAPYAHDDQTPNHYAHCKAQVEDCKGAYVLLAGLDAKVWFESFWGPVNRQGQLVEINGRKVSPTLLIRLRSKLADTSLFQKRIYFIDHMEYIGIYAKNDRLEILRQTLRKMKDSGINTSDEYIDERIATRAAKRVWPDLNPSAGKRPWSALNSSSSGKSTAKRPRTALNFSSGGKSTAKRPQEDVTVIDSDSDGESAAKRARHHVPGPDFEDDDFSIQTPEDFEGRIRIQVDLAEVLQRQRHAESMKVYWSDPENKKKRSEMMKKRWEDPDYIKRQSAFKTEWWSVPGRKEMQSAMQTERAKEHWSNPDNKKKASEAKTQFYSDPKNKKRYHEIMDVYWQDPDNLKRRSEQSKRIMGDPEMIARVAKANSLTRQDPEHKKRTSETSKALWKDDEFRTKTVEANRKSAAVRKAALEENPIDPFHRDDSNPKLKARWDKRVAAADKHVKGSDFSPSFFKSFQLLHLDPKDYKCNPPAGPNFGTDKQTAELRQIKQHIDKKIETSGAPFFSAHEAAELMKQTGWTKPKKALYKIFINYQQDMMRAAARLRHCNVDVDFAGIPHLRWLREIW
jgi:hypothetical protein